MCFAHLKRDLNFRRLRLRGLSGAKDEFLLADGNPAIISDITGGLTLDGADVFEAVNVIRLINRGQPRTEFT